MHKFATKEPKLDKIGQNIVFSMLKRTKARKKYTIAGFGDCDKYEVCHLDQLFPPKLTVNEYCFFMSPQ